MNMNNIIGGIIVIIIILVGGFFLIGGDSVPRGVIPDGASGGVSSRTLDKAPSFSLQDYNGETVSSEDFAGKVLVLNSWATWCPFCVDELPDFGALQEEFSDEIVVIAIDRSESRERAKRFSDDLGVTDKIVFLLDPNDSFYRSIGGFAMPETLFIDTDGNIVVHKRGPMELEEMRNKVNQVLARQ